MAKAKDLMKLINDSGFSVADDGDGLRLIPNRLHINTLKIDITKRGQWISDPRFFPEDRKEENIFWKTEIDATAILQDGEEATIYLMNTDCQLIQNYNTIPPEGY